ncbi:MAG: translational GTPase TypA [Myxococcota bacterium]|nr:translational GTPase TypA [Myxococcota bacterium]
MGDSQPQSKREDLRNFAIVAHIDHGKTTLVDAMLSQAGIFRDNEVVPDRVLDRNDQERERGITIFAKNAAIDYKGIRLNILDTPGHADFGGEVERVLTLADGVILLVDASEGPLPQTRFVMKKAFEANLKPIIVINKIDRKDARADEVLDEVYDLFIDLEADEDILEAPVLYAIARDGIAKTSLDEESNTLEPLFEAIVKHIPAPPERREEPLQAFVSNTDYDDYVGRLATGRVVSGVMKQSKPIYLTGEDGQPKQGKIMRLYSFDGVVRKETSEIGAGDIFVVAGLDKVTIGDTLAGSPDVEPVPRLKVDPPTLSMTFMVNDSPFAGKEGKYLTSRQIRERLMKASAQNVAIQVEDGVSPDQFKVSGRGELQLSVLVESLRREGFELQLSKPEVVTREIDGELQEPMEAVHIDVPEEFIGTVTEMLSPRLGRMTNMETPRGGRVRMEFKIPSRGLIGFRSKFLTETRGTGIITSIVDGWAPFLGPIARRPNGALVADRQGKATGYAMFNLEARGAMFIKQNTEVYEGMVLGENKRETDLNVNITKEKKLTNIRAAGKDDAIVLTPPRIMSLEQCIEFIDEDELIEVTPESLRIRKKILACNIRPKRTAMSA